MTEAAAVMTAQPDVETTSHSPSTMLDSEDSEEETIQEEIPITSWNELSIIERVGLNSVEMSEKDLETAFSQIALAFRCDQYTLKQRLQAEEHARNLAEENIQLELSRGRETLETLKDLCLDIKRSTILQRLELSLDILGGTVERISNTAEVLGAVHQEARVSRAVELMVAHVENLRERNEKNKAELDEAKKTLQQQNSPRNIIDPRGSPDPEDSENRKCSVRRRVSISLISTQITEKIKRDVKKRPPGRSFSKDSFLTCPSLSFESSFSPITMEDSYPVDDRPLETDEAPSEVPAAELPPPPPSIPVPECPTSKPQTTRKTQNKHSSVENLRQRHKGKSASLKKKAERDKKSMNNYRRLSANTCGSLWRGHPLAHWLYRCRWALLFMYLFVLFSVVTMIYYLWKLHDEAPEP